jgi:hypothetical protein
LEVIVGTFFKDDTYEFMMNIALGATHHRGVDIGESLSATASMGQGVALFHQGLYFRPDWAKVLTPVVDFALGSPEVDPERVTIQGVSQAGYSVPRAAAFEVSTSWSAHLPQDMQELLQRGQKEEFDGYMEECMRSSESVRYTLRYRLWSGADKANKGRRVRNDQTAFVQRFSDQSRTTDASGREAHKAHAQLMASGGTAPELLW